MTIAPNRRRWIILALVFLALLMNYIDRQVVSILKPTIKGEFGLDDIDFSFLLNAFTICYASTYIIAGWLSDRFGAGKIMFIGISAWSTVCLVTGFSKTFGQMTILRGALGLVEPLAYPSQLRVVNTWFPATLRATANSICAAGSTIGAVIAPVIIAGLAQGYGWHSAFIVPGVIGLGLAVLWKVFYRNPPLEVTAETLKEERAAGKKAGEKFIWGQLWGTRTLWGIILIRFITDPVWYFCLFWLPGYLQEESGLTLTQIAMFGWIPFLVADLGGVASSAFSDKLVRKGIPTLRSRKLVLTGAAMAAPLCALTPWLANPFATIAIFCVVGAICLTWLFNMGVLVAESFPSQNVGSAWGISGAFGAAGAIIFNALIGYLMTHVGTTLIFTIMAFMHPIAIFLLWPMIRPERPRDLSYGHA